MVGRASPRSLPIRLLTSPHDAIISNRWRSPQANFNTRCDGTRPAGNRHRSGDGAVGVASRGAAGPRTLGSPECAPSRRVARLLFFVHGDRIGVVHGFIKKTQKTPADDLEL